MFIFGHYFVGVTLGELQGEVNKWKTNYSALLSAMQDTDNDIEEFNRITDNLHNIRS